MITFLPLGLHNVIKNIFDVIPIRLEVIQLVAQFCLFGDLVLVVLIVLRIVGNILKNLLVILGVTSVIMVVVYTLANFDQQLVANIVSTVKTFIENVLKSNPLLKNH